MSNVIIGQTLAALASLSGASFASFTSRAKGTGELARHTVILNVNVREVYEKDVATVEAYLNDVRLAADPDPLEIQAAEEILSSLSVSLQGGIGNNPAYAHGADARGEGNETYIAIPGLSGVKIHRETGEVYVYGLSERKVVLEAGTYKEVKSSAKTLAKKAIQKNLRSGKIRQYAIGTFSSARINGETLEFDA